MAVAGVLGGVLAGVIGSGIENGGCDGGIGGDAQIVELEGHFLVAAECEAGVVDGVGDVGDAGFLVLGQLVESCFAVCDEAAVRLDGEVFVVELHGLVADGHLFEGVGVRTNRVEVDCGELQGCFAFVVDQDGDVADGNVLVGGGGAIDCCYLVGGLGDLASTALKVRVAPASTVTVNFLEITGSSFSFCCLLCALGLCGSSVRLSTVLV